MCIRDSRSASVKKILSELSRLAEKQPETYAAFWKEFGKVLKEGVVEDHDNRTVLADLMRFNSTRSDDTEQTESLAAYFKRMPMKQKAIYYIRRCEDIKQDLAGSLFYTTVDGLKGFNQLENTDLASQVLAVLSDLGCLLAKAETKVFNHPAAERAKISVGKSLPSRRAPGYCAGRGDSLWRFPPVLTPAGEERPLGDDIFPSQTRLERAALTDLATCP